MKAFYDAGCRYLQFDDTAWAYLCSPAEMKSAKERGIKTDRVIEDYATLIEKSIADKPADMVITTHVCRGNFRSAWISEGGYEPVAERLLGGIAYDGYFLEYDTDRAGGLRAACGSCRRARRSPWSAWSRRNRARSKRRTTSSDASTRRRNSAPLDQLRLRPQCGFASTEEGNTLTEDQQWAKLPDRRDRAERMGLSCRGWMAGVIRTTI